MTPANESYNEMKVYKYKPVDKLTIDFLIKKCPQKLLGIKPFINKTGSKGTLYILFCGISKKQYTKLNLRFIRYYENIFGDSIKDEDYFPIQFEPSDKQFSYLFWGEPDLDGKIGEFLYLNKEWRLQKIRDDRQVELKRGNYYGNNYKIAELIWINYEDPLIIEKLTVNEMIYFKKNDNPIYKPSRNFNSFVKSRIIESYNSEWVFDLASGKGQDLFRYTNGNYQNILFCEIDRNAISELINRKHDFAKNDNYNSLGIHVQCVDLLKKYKDNIDQISENLPMLPKQVNLIICNFAFHYFLRNKLTTSNICKFISHYLKPGGRFVFSAFDGVKIVELMNETGGKWMVKENDILKYSIIKKYKGDFLVDIGQMINVLLPFSDEEYYPEYLINIKYIEAEFMKYKIKLELSKSFADYIEEYKHNNREKYAEMSENDIKFCSLYSWYSFYRNV